MAVFLWFRDWLPESLHIKVFCLDRFRYGMLFFPTSSIDTDRATRFREAIPR